MTKKTIHIQYYALLREERGISEETIDTTAPTARALYQELKTRYHFRLNIDRLKVAVNDEFKDWGTPLKSEDRIVFIPPVAGG
jgi:molybdopterin converting factor small subunit